MRKTTFLVITGGMQAMLAAVAAAGMAPEQNRGLTLDGFWRLKPRRGQPFSHMRGVLVLLGFS
jgi:hypothetical protein